MPVAIRVNSIGSEWHSLDLDAVARSGADLAVIPRAVSAHLVHGVAEAVARPVLAMIETAAGVIAAPDIAKEAAGLIAGTNDLRADLRLPLDATREPISAALQWIVLSARAAGIAAFDGVFNSLDDEQGLSRRSRGWPTARLRRQEPHPPQPDRALPSRVRAERRRDRPGAAPCRCLQRGRRALRG